MSRARLYVLMGASGVGKNELALQACSRRAQFELCKKEATRPGRKDDTDVVPVPGLDFRDNKDSLGYVLFDGTTYSVPIAHISRRIAQGYSQILIVSSLTAIARLRIHFPTMRTIFVHRDMTEEQMRVVMVERGLSGHELEMTLARRVMARGLLYNQIAGGMIIPDHVVINNTIDAMNAQFDRIVDAAETGILKKSAGTASQPTVNIIITGTGRLKKFALQAMQTVPAGFRSIVPKYLSRQKRDKDGPEAKFIGLIPEECIKYTFFGNEYGVDPIDAAKITHVERVGFVTISDMDAAYRLVWELQGLGIRSRLIYMHQPELDLADYPEHEHEARRQHSAGLLEHYQRRFVIRQDMSVILAESKEVVCSYIQHMLNEAHQD